MNVINKGKDKVGNASAQKNLLNQNKIFKKYFINGCNVFC